MSGNRQTLIIVTLLVALGTAVAARNAVLVPHRQQMAQAQLQLQQEQELLQVRRSLAQRLPLLEQHQMRLSEVDSPEWLMGEVARIAERARVRLTAIEPEATRKIAGEASRVAVVMRFEGRFHDVGHLVSLIESSPKYIHVDELDIKPLVDGMVPRAASDGTSQLIDVRLVLSTLHLPPLARHAAGGSASWER